MDSRHSPASIIALAAAIRDRGNAFLVKALACEGVKDILPAHGAVLHALFAAGPLQMSVLAEAIGRKRNTVTSLINTLEERGYCRREADPGDARAQIVALTAKGEALRPVQTGISAEMLRRAWDGVEESEQSACVRTLARVLRNLEDG